MSLPKDKQDVTKRQYAVGGDTIEKREPTLRPARKDGSALSKPLGGHQYESKEGSVEILPYKKPSFLTRVVDCVIAVIALMVFMPIMIFIGCVVKVNSKGPVLFKQQRIGAGGKLFTFVKFRTFYHDARERFPDWYAYKYNEQELETFRFKVEVDPRIIPKLGWLRNTTLDELPNFWNVLKGDMTLVGPRPEIPEMRVYYQDEMLEKFSVAPGVTGLAQISGRGRLTFRDTVNIDLEYVKNRSFFYDISIIFKTIIKIILRDGAF